MNIGDQQAMSGSDKAVELKIASSAHDAQAPQDDVTLAYEAI